MTRSTRRVLTALLAAMFLTSGCWNARELKDMAIIMAVGIDVIPGSSQYQVSFQVVNSGQVAPKTVSGGSAKTGEPITVYSGEGDTLFEAIRRTSMKVPRQLFFAHIQLVVLGEGLAKKGVSEVFDFFERSRETRLLSTVLVSRGGTASELMKARTRLETIPATAMVGKAGQSAKLWSNSLHTRIDDVIDMMGGEEKVTLISGLEFQQKPPDHPGKDEESGAPAYTQIRGISVLDSGKLAFWLDEPEARGVLWVRDQIKGTVMNIDRPEKKKSVAIEVVRTKTKIHPSYRDGTPKFKIQIYAEGSIVELQAPVDVSKPDEVWKLEKEWAERIKGEVMATVKTAQQKKLDILGFGSRLNLHDPKRWRAVKDNWKPVFAESEVEVQVDAFIRNQGMRGKSHLSKQGK